MAAADFAGKHYRQLVYRFIHIVRLRADYHIGAVYFYAPLGYKFVLFAFVRAILEIYPQSDDFVLVSEYLGHLVYHVVFQCLREFKIIARDYDFVIVHLFPFYYYLQVKF